MEIQCLQSTPNIPHYEEKVNFPFVEQEKLKSKNAFRSTTQHQVHHKSEASHSEMYHKRPKEALCWYWADT